MPRISEHFFITLAITFALLANLNSVTGSCEICMYDGTAYDKTDAGPTAERFCTGLADEMTIETTPGKTCTYRGYYTHFKDYRWGGQKTYCRIQCKLYKSNRDLFSSISFFDTSETSLILSAPLLGEDSTACLPAGRDIGGPKVHNAFIARTDLPCDEWPLN